MTNSYTKFQVNISKDSRKNLGKLKYDGQTDRRTERQTDGRTDGQTDSEQTNSPPASRYGTKNNNQTSEISNNGHKDLFGTLKIEDVPLPYLSYDIIGILSLQK